MKKTDKQFDISRKFILIFSISVILPLLLLAIGLLILNNNSALNENNFFIAILIAGLVAILLIAGAILIINKQFIKPIHKITLGLQSIKDGYLTQQQSIADKDLVPEISNLVQGYNQFLDLLKVKEKQEEALKVSEERYDLAMKGSNDGVWDWDLLKDNCYYSPRWRIILGYTEESIRNSPAEWFSRVHADDLDGLQADIQAHLEGKTSHFENEHRVLHANGSYIWVLTRGLALFDDQKKAYRFAGSISDSTKRKDFESMLLHDAMHDPLTQSPNREYFLEIVGNALGRTQRREDYHAAIVYLDLDRFKLINDGIGYAAGDELLIEISIRLKQALRLMDTVARIGGDEFGILLEEINGLQDAIQITRRLHKILTQPIILENQEITPNASFGIVMLTRGYLNAEEVLQDADTALNQAKANGRGRFEIFDKEMHFYTLSKLKIESELNQAIKRKEIKVYFQPVIEAKSGDIDFVEALMRWHHPTKGLIATDELIPIAEETGLITAIDSIVLRTACAEAKKWLDSGFSNLRVSVNISPKLLLNPDMTNIIRTILADTELPYPNLILEITESAGVYTSGTAIQNLFELTSIGIRVFLDDYGSVASSLEQLKRLPLHAIKISQAFIKDLPVNTDDAAIITAIISMAHILDLKVIGVGIDNLQQMKYLVQKKCDYLQGYLFAHPTDPANFLKMLFEKGTNLIAKFETIE